jgi:hypothetical protein
MNPDNVIATCIVAKNLAGCDVKAANLNARLSPCEASFASLLSFIEMTAISAQAKIAFNAIRTTCKKICHINGSLNKIKTSLILPYVFTTNIYRQKDITVTEREKRAMPYKYTYEYSIALYCHYHCPLIVSPFNKDKLNNIIIYCIQECQ